MNIFFVDSLHQYGYPALWFIIFVAAFGAPISGNLLLYAAGAFAAFGDFNIFALFFVGLTAAVLGDALAYFVGWKVGTPLFAWFETQKRLRFISPQLVARSRAYFRRRAGWAVFLSRFLIVVLGGPINWLAGAEHYPYRKFLFWDITGQALGAAIPLGIGFTFAASWGEASNIFGAFSSFILASLVAAFLSIVLFRQLRSKRLEKAQIALTTPLTPIGKPAILILISRSGGGHLNLAQALQNLLEPHYTVTIADPQSAIVERWYTWLSRHLVKGLDWQYLLTDHKLTAWLWQNVIALSDYKRCATLLQKTQPQLIITTHALVSYVAARANEDSPRRVPLVFQLTDLERVHLAWFTEKGADAYLAPTREIFAQVLEQGIPAERVHLTGRPIRQQFMPETSATFAREEILAELDFDPAIFTFFLQGGARGSAHSERLIQQILALQTPVQIILAAGNNTALATRYAGNPSVRVLPFTDCIAPYMAAADVIAGKAGASFISEAFMLEKPFLVTSVIPAQEGPGLEFIKRYNLGWICLHQAEQQELLAKLTSSPQMIADKVHSIQAYKVWNSQANQDLLPVIDHLLLPEDRLEEEKMAQ